MSARLGIIGGYLGSGKTTLVNLLLAGALPGRTAVVVNDFGSVNIDPDLIASADGDTIELTNGCICCQLSDDVARTMTALAARDDLDHVLCEVSGVGNPGELATWRSYPGFAPGPVLVCADATAVGRLLRDQYVGDTVSRQLASAEVVLLTKTDLAGPADLKAAQDLCRTAAPGARLVVQDHLHPASTAATAFAGASGQGGTGDGAIGRRSPDPEIDTHTQAHVSSNVHLAGPVDVGEVVQILDRHAGRLARAKGTVQDRNGLWHEVQLASGNLEVRLRAPDRLAPSAPGLVLIAAGSDPAAALSSATEALSKVRTVQ